MRVGPVSSLAPFDRELLRLLRDDLPLTERPFAVLAATLGAEEQEVLDDARRLLAAGVFDRIAPVYAPAAFGFASTLAVARVDPAELWLAERVLALHPGVSHVTIRDHPFDVWFTVAVHPESQLGLGGTVLRLGELMSASATARLDLIGVPYWTPWSNVRAGAPEVVGRRFPMPTAMDGHVAEVTQEGLAIEEEPFERPAALLGLPQALLLEHLRDMRARGALLRLGALTPAEGTGQGAKGLIALERADVPRLLEACREVDLVRHYVRRRAVAGWPYEHLVTVAGAHEHELHAAADAVIHAARPASSAWLPTRSSGKQRRLVVASTEHLAWERMHGPPGLHGERLRAGN